MPEDPLLTQAQYLVDEIFRQSDELRKVIATSKARMEASRRVLGDHPPVVSFADLFTPHSKPQTR